MTLTELYESVEQDSRICDMTTKKIGIYLDALFRENEINCEEAELKSNDIDDLTYLIEEANDGLITKTINGIKKIVNTVIEFIKKMGEKLKEFFTGKPMSNVIKKTNEAIKKNPKLGKVKVTVPDIEGNQKFCKTEMSKLDRLLAKIYGGHLSPNNNDEADEIIARLNKRKKAVAIGAGVTVTLAAAIATLTSLYKKGEKNITEGAPKNIESIASKLYIKISGFANNPKINPKMVQACKDIGCQRIEAEKVCNVILAQDTQTYAREVLNTAKSFTINDTVSGPTIQLGPKKSDADDVSAKHKELLKAFHRAASSRASTRSEKTRRKNLISTTKSVLNKFEEEHGLDITESVFDEYFLDDIYDSILEYSSYDDYDDYDENIDSLFNSIVESVCSDNDTDEDITELLESIDDLF